MAEHFRRIYDYITDMKVEKAVRTPRKRQSPDLRGHSYCLPLEYARVSIILCMTQVLRIVAHQFIDVAWLAQGSMPRLCIHRMHLSRHRNAAARARGAGG